MNKVMLVLMLIITISLLSYSAFINQNESYDTDIKFKNKFKNTKFIVYCKGGNPLYQGEFKDGKKNGEWVTYYQKNKNHKIKYVENYIDGKKGGVSITYDENGKIKYREIYKNGEKISSNTVSRFSHLKKIETP